MPLQAVRAASKATRSACLVQPSAPCNRIESPATDSHAGDNASRAVAGKSSLKTRRCAARFHRAISQIGTAASFSLNPDLLRATGVCLHVDLFASIRRDNLERGG